MLNKIVCIDKTNLQPWAIQQLQELCTSPISVYEDYPGSAAETIQRIGDADGIFVSWHTPVDAVVLQQAPNLRYIGMCCSLIDKNSSNVDVTTAESLGIEVRGVKDYGDEGVVEFLFAQLISLAKGLHQQQWKSYPTELKGKSLGIIGLGTLGKMVADVALVFGMQVYYYSRTRKPDLESERLVYLPLHDLLARAEVITTHLPRNIRILGSREFRLIKPNSILINTSLGPTYSIEAFESWIGEPNNFAIMDADGAEGYVDLYRRYDNVLLKEQVAGMTDGAYTRLSEKVVRNIIDFCTHH